MPYLEHHPIDYFPHNLLQDELAEPRLAIHRIFGEELNMVDARRQLEKWLALSFFEQCMPGRRFLLVMLGLQEAMLRLLEAAHLLRLEAEGLRPEVPMHVIKSTGLPAPALYCGRLHRPYTAWDYMPRHLTRREFAQPYRVFDRVAQYKRLPEWRDTLHHFFAALVSGRRIYTCCEDRNLYLTCKLLLKLVEAAHLVHVREGMAADD